MLVRRLVSKIQEELYFFDVARIIKEKSPKFIFLENVKGLLSHKKGETFKVILSVLDSLNYNVNYKVLNAKDFGVPQKRQRVYMVCVRKDINNTFKFPEPDYKECNLKDILESNVDAKYFLSQRAVDSLNAKRQRHSEKGNRFGYEVVKDCSNALMCGGMGKERNLVQDFNTPTVNNRTSEINDMKYRYMTPREWARLQGFPDTFILSKTNKSAYKQLGNSVVVPLINKIAKQISNENK